LALLAAKNFIEVRKVQRRYAVRFSEHAYEGHGMLTKTERPLWERWLKIHRKGKWESEKKVNLEMYWWLQIVRFRESGELPAWEGIQIIREQVASEPNLPL